MTSLNFTDADLKANREGRLSDAQRKRLDARVDEKKHVMRIMVPIAGVVLVIILIVGLSKVYQSAGNDLTVLFSPAHHLVVYGSIIAVAALFIAVAVGAWLEVQLYARGHIKKGTAVLRIRSTRVYGADPKPIYELRLQNLLSGGHRIYLDDADSLQEGVPYHIYYLQDKPIVILSLEEKHESKPAARKKSS